MDRLAAREQTVEDAYGLPENFLEVEVTDPQTHGDAKQPASQFTDYLITVDTNLPAFKMKQSRVRRRYSDFEWLRDALEKEVPRVNLPLLPGKLYRAQSRLDPAQIEARRAGMERFLQIVAGHPLLQTGSKILGPFLQDPHWHKENYRV